MLVIAHRGASGREPENSYEAFQTALELEAEAVEADLRKCKYCGQIVLSHDRVDVFKKHQNSLTLKDFLSSDFAEWMDLHLEIKEKGIINEIFALTGEVAFKDHIIYSSFRWSELWKIRRKYRRARIGLLWDWAETKLPIWLTAVCGKVLGAESVHLNFENLGKKTVTYFRKKGFLVYAYTVNSVDEIAMARNLGLDGIFTDYPDLARDVLSKPVQ